MSERLIGKVAVITGAASGVGRAMSLRCAAEGAAVLCVDIDDEALRETTLRVEMSGGQVEAQVADVSQEDAVENALRKASEHFGKIDVVMNNAGIGGANADWPRIISVNLEGVYYGLKYGAMLLSEQGGGAIVNTASVGALVALKHYRLPPDGSPLPSGSLAYVAAKSGVVGLTRQFAVAYGHRNVRVNAIAPGGIDTPMLRGDSKATAGEHSPADAIHPMRRIAQPEEIAAAALFLASDESAFITGVVLPVDGGYTAK